MKKQIIYVVLVACSLLLTSNGIGQVIHATGSGFWSDSSIFDCNCIPTSVNDVIIDATSVIEVDVNLNAKSITIMSAAVLNCLDTMVVYTIEEDFVMYDNDIYLDGIMHVGGDFKILTTIGGFYGQYGRVCVADSTINNGLMDGIDICDLSPSSPTIDLNTGTIGTSVTFCDNGGICTPTGTVEFESSKSYFEVFPNPSGGVFNLSFVLKFDEEVVVTVNDILGRNIYTDIYSGSRGINTLSLELPAGINSGIYILNLKSEYQPATRRVVIR